MMLLLKLTPALVALVVAVAMVVLTQPAPLYA